TYVRAYQKLGAHAVRAADGTVGGTRFAVWAPNAAEVAVIGDFNGWDRRTSPLAPRGDSSGIWEGLVQGVGPGALYKYHIASRHAGAGHDAPLLRLPGRAGDGLLRTECAVRHATRLHVLRRAPAPPRHRRDPPLRPLALTDRRGRARALRRHAPLRARRPAPGIPSGVEQLHLQLRPRRGAQLPRQQRALLARHLPRRCAAG